MKIKVEFERECCERDDLKPYRGFLHEQLKNSRPMFCIHCGQLWAHAHDCMGDCSVLKRVLWKELDLED